MPWSVPSAVKRLLTTFSVPPVGLEPTLCGF
jgi:hypothetical protein